MADVYAADDALGDTYRESTEARLITFHLSTDAEPEVLSRVASQLYIFNLPPERVTLQRTSDETFNIEILILCASDRQMESACRKFQQLTCMLGVEAITANGTRVYTSY